MSGPDRKAFDPLPDISGSSPADDCCSQVDGEKPSCCDGSPKAKPESATGCCSAPSADETETSACCGSGGKLDWILWGSLLVVLLALILEWFWRPVWGQLAVVGPFAHHLTALMLKMSWGIGAGILAVGLLSWVPRAWIFRMLGRGGSFSGLLRATFAGLLLDLCNHGILMVASQLYRKGATLGQTVAFLVASPWNSLSMTLILIALIGWQWTLAFIVLSMVVALIGGWIIEKLVAGGVLPPNPHGKLDGAGEIPGRVEVKRRFSEYRAQHQRWLWQLLKDALGESRMILRWILFGAVLAAAIEAFVPTSTLSTWFGPTWLGLLLTLAATTVIEVCSEGSSPIAADLLGRASAPGNAFTFLMAGAATDYTELLVLRETTGRWKCALVVPLVTVPQILLIGWLLNQA